MSTNVQIAKNTIILYLRMFIVTIISLYSSRIILNSLGIEDFGIYNIAGGLVALLGMLNSSMSASTQRFLNIKLGSKDIVGVHNIFNASISLHLFLAILLIVVGETIGFWLFKTQIEIPPNRVDEANWVYHLTLITSCFMILRTPYISATIAYERMRFFAYIGIVEVVLKLMVAFAILYTPIDRLLMYTILLMCISFVMYLLNWWYCIYKLKLPKFKIIIFADYKELLSFSGWSLLGNLSNTGSWQVMNIIFNSLFGVLLNAVMGITNQVSSALANLILSFQTAFKPQIIKLYASGESESFFSLLFRSSKISFFLVYIFLMPLFFNCNFVLNLWLKEVPEYTSLFVQIMIIHFLIDSMTNPLLIAIEASGNIKHYQIKQAISLYLIIGGSYLFTTYKNDPISLMAIKTLLGVITLAVIRLYYIKKECSMSIQHYCIKVLKPVLGVFISTFPFYLLSSFYLDGLNSLIISVLVALTINLMVIYKLGLTKQECVFLNNYKNKLANIFNI